MDAGKCDANGNGIVEFTKDVSSADPVELGWGFHVDDFACKLAGMDVVVQGLQLGKKNNDLTVSTKTFQVAIGEASKYLADKPENDASKSVGYSSSSGYADKLRGKGVRIDGLRYDGVVGFDAVRPVGLPDLDNLALEIPGIGVTVISKLDVMPLFDDDPGFAFDNVRLALPGALGGDTLSTNFSVLFNGNPSYVHVRGSMNELPLRIPGIKLTDDIGFDGAKMVIRFNKTLNGKGGWSFEGTAGLNLAGPIGKLNAELAVEKPDPNRCKVGVCKAVVSMRLKNGARVPLGTTGLYIAGLKGAFYDGDHQPPCAKKCTGVDMPRGMKVELAVFLEAQSASILKGTTGVWVQLNRINFGIYGDFQMLEGTADADACAAVFGGGKQFHGEVNVRLHTMLAVQGGFIIDIWSDNSGNNMAAEASASVGLERGAIIKSRWFKFPRSTYWLGPFVTRFGRFEGGSNGFTTGVRALGRTWGVGYVDSRFRLGNVASYRLAKPKSNGSLFLGGSDYRLVPLGLQLHGGEVLSVNVGAAEGVDWRGAKIQLIKTNLTDDGRGNTSISTKNLTTIDEMDDTTVTRREDSANIHSLIYLNRSTKQRVLVAIPKRAGTDPTGEEQPVDGANLASSTDDLQVFLGLMDPTVSLTAQKCIADTTTVCVSGSVVDFRKDPIEYKKSLSDTERTILDKDADLTSKVVLLQKHHLKFWAIPVWDTTGGVGARDSAIPLEIPSSELTNLATCVTALPTGQTGVALNNCQWKPGRWKSGRYGLMAGVEGEDLLPTLADPTQPGEMFLLDQTRRILSKPGESTPLSIAVSYPDPMAPITGLAVFGSALDSAQSGASDQRRTFFARWVAGNHPDMQGHFVRWTDSRNAQHMFHAGTAGQWSWDIPLADAYVTKESDLWDPTDTMGRVRGVQTAYQWMFEPPVKLEVAPAVLLRAPDKDSFYLSPRWDLAASWSGSSVLGHAAGGTKNGLTFATTPAMQAVELNQTRVDTLKLNVTEFDVGSTSTRVATDYAHMDLQLMGPTGQPLSEALQKAAPSVSAALESWRFGSNSLKIPLHFTARSAAQLCQARLMMKDSSWVNTDTSVCKVGDTLMPATTRGDYQVKLRIWNEGRLEAGQETVVMVPVKVTPPRPRIDRVSPDYLLGMRRQKIRLEASNLWVDAQGRKPVVALRDGQGNWVRFVANGTTTRGTERELVPDANGRVDTTFEVELGNEYNVPGVDNRLELIVFHRDAAGVRWEKSTSLPYIEKPGNWECLGTGVGSETRHEIRAMDFVGFYPKTIGLRDTVTALFSEIHNPDFVTWQVRVAQDTHSTPAKVVDVDAGRVRFVLPDWVVENQRIEIVLNIPDTSAGEFCKDQNWHQTLTTAPAVGGSNVPRQLKASAQSGAPLVSFPSLLPDQRFEWVRGNPPQGWAWNWIQGMPTTSDVPQTDWLNLRLRRPETGVQWQAKWLVVTPPREISLATTARTLRRRDTLPAGTNLAWSLAPVATRGRNGTSVPVMQCRWNDAVWETCADQSLKVDLQRQGALELRLGWKLFLPVGDTMVWEPVQSWSLSVRPTNLDNVERVTLRLDGQRLAHLIDGQVTKTVLRVRRSGTELSRWDATAPVVRDVSGQILPQQTEVWDPVAKRYEAWVEVADLAPNRSVTLELWLNDKSPVQAPSALDAWHGSSSSAGTIGAAVAAAGQKQSVSLPASAMRGWTSSLWLRWNPDAAETVWSSTPLEWGTRTNGSLWLKYRGDSVVSAPGVLDAQGPMLVGASWEVPSGRLSLWANGQRVASKMVAAQDERVVDPATVQVGGRYAVDELRWSQANTTSWKLRWESERPGSKLWEPWTSMAPVAPHVLESRGAVGNTLSLVTGAPVWADREAQVTSVPAAWAGAAWLPGLAFRAKDTALQAAWIRAERFAQVCAVGDASWQPRTGWTRQSTDLSTSLGARAVWCHPLPSEVSGLPGPRDAQTASQTALSWFVLPTTGTTTPVVIQPGQNLDGWTLPATLPASLSGASLPNTVKSPDGTLVDSRRPGGFLVLVPLAQFLPSMGTVVDTVWVRKVDGSTSQVLVVWTETAPKIDSIRVLVAPPRAVVPRDPSASWKIFTSKDSVKLPDGSTPRWDMPAPVLGPRTCEERVFEANFRRPSELWLALPPGVRTQALLGWKSAGEVALGGKTWTQWTRSIEPGRFTWDATLVFGEGTCVSFLLVAVERWRNLPDWTLPSVRLGAVGGSAVLQGGIHRIKNLEIQHAAALYLHSQQYSMKLLSATGLGQKLVSSVLSLGVPQIKELRDPETGLPEYVQVSSQFALHDLRADLLDADSVKVDLRNLRASGKARLTVTQYGATRFVGGIYAVLFRDRNGDMRYTAGADDLIGMEAVGSIGAGESVKIDFALDQHSRNFPEEVFMAWIDAGAVSPERVMGDHVALGGNPCREAKATRWLDAQPLTRPNGTVVVKVHLRDTDHDNLVRDRDSMDVLWYQAGNVCRALSLDADTLWCVAAPSVGSNSDLSVTDLDADGVPEIVAGNTVLRRDGTVLWNAENFTGTTWSDFDADGRTDTLRGSSACHTVIAGTGEVLWSQGTGCAITGRYPKLSAILAHPARCADVSVSGIQVRVGSVWVRVANSGTTTLPAGIVLVRTNADGTVERNRVLTTQPLAADAFEDLEIGTDSNLTDRVQVLPGTLRDLGVWEFSTRNNRGNLSGELRP
ncbi:MAG: hypothetical protein IPN71_21600 [Fibrobacteres bacterium]|nr:hypothetical protein [Fibrobacterota bacterium]